MHLSGQVNIENNYDYLSIYNGPSKDIPIDYIHYNNSEIIDDINP